MNRKFDTEKYLENRQFIMCDQLNAQQKIKQLKEGKSKPIFWWKLKTFLKQLFKYQPRISS